MVVCTFLTSDRCHICLTKSGGRFDQRVKYGLQVECRAADDLENVRGRRLLLQRLAQLIQEPNVLDSNDCLIGESSNELNLFLGKWPHDWSRQYEHTKGRPLP